MSIDYIPVSGQLPTNIIWSKDTGSAVLNNSWTIYYDNFTGYGFTGYTGDAGFTFNNYGGLGGDYHVKYGVNSNLLASGTTGIYRNSISLKALKKSNLIPYQTIDSNDSSWVSYETHSGEGIINNSQNVFSYAIEIVKSVVSSRPLIKSGSGAAVLNNNAPDISGDPPKIILLTGNMLRDMKVLQSVDCSYPQPDFSVGPPVPFLNFTDVKACWTGNDITGIEYNNYIKYFLKSITGGSAWRGLSPTQKIFQYNSGTLSQEAISYSGAPISSGLFDYITGSIICYPFVTGDSISFDLYTYDYTGLYKQYHNSLPVYPNTGFTLNYPQDFTGVEDLVNVLNYRLNSPMSYPVWYPYLGLSGAPYGLYFTGSLMSFNLINKDYAYNLKNKLPVISFVSNRNYTSGFHLSSKFTPRIQIPIDNGDNQDSLNKISGYSYLIPNEIQLQGYDTGSNKWVVLDKQINLFNKLTGLMPTVILYTGYSGWLEPGEELYYPPPDSGNITGGPPPAPKVSEQINYGQFVTIYETTQTGWAQRKNSQYCAPISNTRRIELTWPSGFASGFLSGCAMVPRDYNDFNICSQWMYEQKISGIKLFTDAQVDDPTFMGCEVGTLIPYVIIGDETCWLCTGAGSDTKSGTSRVITSGLFYRTGWNLNPTGHYLNCLLSNTIPPYDITQLNFNKYRVVCNGFSGQRPVNNADLYLKPLNSFLFRNINFFSAEKKEMTDIFVTGLTPGSLFGSKYTLQVQGTSQLAFDYVYSYSISGQQNSGIYHAFNEGAFYTPTGSEKNVSFRHGSGTITGQVTGFVSGIFTGSGIISHNFNTGNYYYYDPNTKQVTFDHVLSKYVESGQGILSGQATVLTQEAIGRSIIVGGIFSDQSYFTSFTSGNADSIKGNITVPYEQDGVLGYYILTGSITGTSKSGYLNYNLPVSGQYDSNHININNPAYYYKPTGFLRASAMILVNFSALRNYDYIAINSQPITYYSTPNSNYFTDISGLLNTINLNQSAYLVSGLSLNDASFGGQHEGKTGIMLYSLLSGASGNNITISSDTTSGIQVPSGNTLTGGRDLYSLMLNPVQFVPDDPYLYSQGIDLDGSYQVEPIMFTGRAIGTLYKTGFYSSVLPTGKIFGPINTYQLTRNFENTWGISTGLPNKLVTYNSGNLTPSGYFGIISGDKNLGVYENLLNINLNYYNHYNIPNQVGQDIIDLYITGYNFPSGSGIIFRITGIK
jgi:hypothetical protein